MSQVIASYCSTGLVGNLLALATATPINYLSLYNQISTSTSTNNAFALPVNPLLGIPYLIRNDGVFQAQLFPGNTASQINALGAAASLVLSPGSQVTLIAASNSQAATPVVQWYHYAQFFGGTRGNTLTGITALAGGAQLASPAPGVGISIYNVSTCATSGDSISLPRSANAVINQPILITNNGVASVQVYPSATNADNCLINNFGANISAWIGSGASAYFVPVTITAAVVQWQMYGYSGPAPVVVITSATGAITRGMSNATVILNAVAGTYPLPLIAVASGCSYKLVLGAAAVGSLQIITAGAGTPIFGSTIAGPIAANNPSIVLGAGTLTVRFSTTCRAGDTIDMVCDGTTWFTKGWTSSNVLATGILFVT